MQQQHPRVQWISDATLYRIREQAQLAAWEALCAGIPMTWIAA